MPHSSNAVGKILHAHINRIKHKCDSSTQNILQDRLIHINFNNRSSLDDCTNLKGLCKGARLSNLSLAVQNPHMDLGFTQQTI